jgi:PAS domain S-box-containing protein
LKKATGEQTAAQLLRRQAEDVHKKTHSEKAHPQSENETQRLIHELEVHQIELEMQNIELRQAWSAAEDALDKYTELYDFAPTGYFTLAKDGKIIGLNLYGASLLGKERQNLLHKQLFFFISDETKPVFIHFLDRIYSNKTNQSCELVLTTGKEDRVYVLASGIVGEKEEQCLISMVDISERNQLLMSLKQSEKLLHVVIDHLPVPVAYVSLPGQRYQFVNQKYADSVGLSVENITGKHVSEILDKQRFDYAMSFLERIQDGDECSFDNSFVIAGEQRWMETNFVPNSDESGKVIGFVVMNYDITERQQVEDGLRDFNVILEHRVEKRTKQMKGLNEELTNHLGELEQFSYIINHDLQEPLHALTTFSGLLREHYAEKLDEDGNQYLDFIFKATDRMNDLIKGLFIYSLLGKYHSKTSVDCNVIVAAVLSDLKGKITESGAEITVQPLPTLIGYETELKLLFQNLITNALKFHKQDIAPEISISSERDKDAWIFKIADNGIGIEPKHLNKIFVIFQRLHNRSDYPGTGIGLAHCKKIVELHHGRIWVESTPGNGSVFSFTIPEAPVQA